jgi:hypothetical protein
MCEATHMTVYGLMDRSFSKDSRLDRSFVMDRNCCMKLLDRVFGAAEKAKNW